MQGCGKFFDAEKEEFLAAGRAGKGDFSFLCCAEYSIGKELRETLEASTTGTGLPQ